MLELDFKVESEVVMMGDLIEFSKTKKETSSETLERLSVELDRIDKELDRITAGLKEIDSKIEASNREYEKRRGVGGGTVGESRT